MPRIKHFVKSQDAFLTWNQDRPETNYILFRKHRDELLRASKGEFCCACGKYISKGTQVYQTSVTCCKIHSEE